MCQIVQKMCRRAQRLVYIHTHIPTYIHTYINTYIHTHIQVLPASCHKDVWDFRIQFLGKKGKDTTVEMVKVKESGPEMVAKVCMFSCLCDGRMHRSIHTYIDTYIHTYAMSFEVLQEKEKRLNNLYVCMYVQSYALPTDQMVKVQECGSALVAKHKYIHT